MTVEFDEVPGKLPRLLIKPQSHAEQLLLGLFSDGFHEDLQGVEMSIIEQDPNPSGAPGTMVLEVVKATNVAGSGEPEKYEFVHPGILRSADAIPASKVKA